MLRGVPSVFPFIIPHLIDPFFVSLEPNTKSGLKKKSVVDCFQIRAVSQNRFAEKIGELSDHEIDRIKSSIALILDIEPIHCEE